MEYQVIKGILFDKDGTLIDFNAVWGAAAGPALERFLAAYCSEGREQVQQRLMEQIGIHGDRIDPEGAFAWMSFGEIAEVIWDYLEKEPTCRLPEDSDTGRQDLLERLKSEFYLEAVEKRTDYPTFTDVKELFRMLTEELGMQVGLVTTDTLDSARACLNTMGASPYITFWGADDGSLPLKPDGRLGELAARQWNLRPEELVIVGDTPNDMRFAHNCGAFALGVLSGTGRREDMEDSADDLIESVAELPAWLRSRK